MPKLRTLVVDCTSQAAVASIAPLAQAFRLPYAARGLYLPTVRNVVLNNINALFDLQILLSAVPNATSLALTSPPGDYPNLMFPSIHPLPHLIDGRMASVTRLTVLEATPDTRELRAFVEAKLPALSVVELDGRCDRSADLKLLKDRVNVRYVSGDDMDLDCVLDRMKSANA